MVASFNSVLENWNRLIETNGTGGRTKLPSGKGQFGIADRKSTEVWGQDGRLSRLNLAFCYVTTVVSGIVFISFIAILSGSSFSIPEVLNFASCI